MLEDLEELASEFFMLQYITKPTHKDGNILDLCFCSNPLLIHSFQCDLSIKSHHRMIKCYSTLSISSPQEQSFRHPNIEDGPGAVFDSLNFHSDEADWEGLDKSLKNVNWEELGNLEPEKSLDKFIKACAERSAVFIPKRKDSGPVKKKASRIPRTRRILMRRRTKVNEHLTKPLTETQQNKFTAELIDIEKKLQESYRTEKSDMEHKAVNTIKKNRK